MNFYRSWDSSFLLIAKPVQSCICYFGSTGSHELKSLTPAKARLNTDGRRYLNIRINRKMKQTIASRRKLWKVWGIVSCKSWLCSMCPPPPPFRSPPTNFVSMEIAYDMIALGVWRLNTPSFSSSGSLIHSQTIRLTRSWKDYARCRIQMLGIVSSHFCCPHGWDHAFWNVRLHNQYTGTASTC